MCRAVSVAASITQKVIHFIDCCTVHHHDIAQKVGIGKARRSPACLDGIETFLYRTVKTPLFLQHRNYHELHLSCNHHRTAHKALNPMVIHIDSLDHLVLTVNDILATVFFYTRALAMEEIISSDGRVALCFGRQKINLHLAGDEFEPHATVPQPGSADLCLLSSTPLDEAIIHLRNVGVEIIEGPVRRIGTTGPLLSIYFRDPDGNLIELANQLTD